MQAIAKELANEASTKMTAAKEHKVCASGTNQEM